jgi:hypothetical protein
VLVSSCAHPSTVQRLQMRPGPDTAGPTACQQLEGPHLAGLRRATNPNRGPRHVVTADLNLATALLNTTAGTTGALRAATVTLATALTTSAADITDLHVLAAGRVLLTHRARHAATVIDNECASNPNQGASQ